MRLEYFQMLDAAAQRQTPRHEDETPRRFAPRLTDTLDAPPPEEAAIATITDAFERVRYAGEEVDAAQVQHLESLWERLRTILRS